MVFNDASAKAQSFFLNTSGEVFTIVGEGKSDITDLLSDWQNQRYGDIVQRTSKISNSIPDESVGALIDIMKRLKLNNYRLTPVGSCS